MKKLSIPAAVKLSSFYSNPLNFIKKMDQLGPGGFVLFNRLFQPDINTCKQEQSFPFRLSSPGYHRLPLRFTGLLYGNIETDICSSSGVFEGEGIIKLLLAGANCVQCVSTLYKNGIGHIATILDDIKKWMKDKGHKRIDDFRGRLSLKNQKNPFAYQGAQYVDLLMKGKPVLKDYNR